ncbi:hypothetical protein AB9F41_36885, partial [Rhizobium leguminosarum]
GNFALLVGLVRKNIPLPFASLKNRRTLVALPNLVDLIIAGVKHPGAAGQTFLAGDGEDLSTRGPPTKPAEPVMRHRMICSP